MILTVVRRGSSGRCVNRLFRRGKSRYLQHLFAMFALGRTVPDAAVPACSRYDKDNRQPGTSRSRMAFNGIKEHAIAELGFVKPNGVNAAYLVCSPDGFAFIHREITAVASMSRGRRGRWVVACQK